MSKRIFKLGLPSVSLLLLLACGGGSSKPAPAPAATSITYTNPTGVPATSCYLNKNASLSTGTHLVLDLYGPATAVTGSGVVLTLNLDTTKATWSPVPVANGSVFVSNANGAPIVQGRISGGTLQVVATERGLASAKPFSGPLLRVALDLKAGQAIGSTITLTPDLTKSQVTLGSGIASMPDLRIGTLVIQ